MLQMYFSEGHTYILMTPNAKPINTATGPIIHRYQRKKEKKKDGENERLKEFRCLGKRKMTFYFAFLFYLHCRRNLGG